MTLSTPAPRRHLHTRKIACEGYEREDGLFDIEARIIDTKTYEIAEPYRGLRQPGMHVHDMQLRLTLDRAMTVRDIEVTTNDAPYAACPTVAPGYKALRFPPKPAGTTRTSAVVPACLWRGPIARQGRVPA